MMRRFALLFAAAACGLLQGCVFEHLTRTIPAGQNLNQVQSDQLNDMDQDSANYTYRPITIENFQSQSFAVTLPSGGTTASTGNVYGFQVEDGVVHLVQLGGPTTGGGSLAYTGSDTDWATLFAAPNTDTSDSLSNNAGTAFSTVKDPTYSSSGLIGWGRWTGTPTYVNGVATNCCSANQSLHYVFGTPTPDAGIPLSGSATFSLIGGTSPTLADGSVAPGTLTAGAVAVLWGGATSSTRLEMGVEGTIGGYAFRVTTPNVGLSLTGITATTLSPIIYNPATHTFSGTWTTPDGVYTESASGFFAGANAQEIGLTYSGAVYAPVTFAHIGTVQGAAAFRR